ncbi:hypothetical protein GO495_27480 [Chitinophaga oryziterrae]|uniref:Alpha-galactosidase n=1 Tax=Chitinophaga oryziterrae TaxID=1031224 RepID=A0A6N8JJ30_9BACT|nr:alpha-galactosidase [Chitinophaga oryziterrae]MVT44366.1 hypothetical protein [Chitinophaga oryziterrae]
MLKQLAIVFFHTVMHTRQGAKTDFHRGSRLQLLLSVNGKSKLLQSYLGVLDNMLTANPGIAYIKWDCNRMITNGYSPYLKDNQSALYIEYTRSLYQVLKRLRAKYPHLPIMLCSGGGGRVDYGALPYFTEFWPSDSVICRIVTGKHRINLPGVYRNRQLHCCAMTVHIKKYISVVR